MHLMHKNFWGRWGFARRGFVIECRFGGLDGDLTKLLDVNVLVHVHRKDADYHRMMKH